MSLEELVEKLRQIFADDHIDKDSVVKVLESYKSTISDWTKYAKWDPHKYTRNLVDQGNGKYNLIVLCWPNGMGSQIHDHTDAHCFVKILDGKLLETKFEWPDKEGENMHETERTIYDKDGVSYMSDQLGLHRMENPSHSDGAVSLHLYVPPYQTCNAFDQRTGQKTKCTVTFYSKYGEVVDYRGTKDGRTCSQVPASGVSISCSSLASDASSIEIARSLR